MPVLVAMALSPPQAEPLMSAEYETEAADTDCAFGHGRLPGIQSYARL